MPEQRYSRIRRAICEHPWAIHPGYLDVIVEIVEMRIAGDSFSEDEKRERIEAAERPREKAEGQVPGNIKVLPLHGVIAHRIHMVEEVSGSGGTSAEGFERQIRETVADDAIDAIVLDVDSPGGSVHGIEELGDTIYAARGSKPIVAVANAWAASAAYWIASQADELVVTPSGEVGSIGVLAVHDDLSGAAEQMGLRRTYLTAGRFKAEGNETEPLADEAREYLQTRIDEYYDTFVRAVARGRKVALKTARGESFGEGRMVGAAQAVAAGMADRVGTLRETIDRVAAKSRRRRRSQARVALVRARARSDLATWAPRGWTE